MNNLKPMEAVAALYSSGDEELARNIVAGLNHAIFHGSETRTAGSLQRAMARISYRILKWTTRTGPDEAGTGAKVFRNRLLDRSGHPYARSLLDSSGHAMAALVEGGDPMNGPYMMIPPAMRKNGELWDRLFFDSVQARDVQSRMVWETQGTYEEAARRLNAGHAVRLKAVAAGTGLSMILAYDQLIRAGYDPDRITVKITDREKSNTDKANRLLSKLPATAGRTAGGGNKPGISAVAEDIFEGPGGDDPAWMEPFDIVTAIGILEYFPGSAYATTEQRLRLAPPVESVTAHDLVARLAHMTTEGASLIVNTYRADASTRILELFGKRFVYRRREDLRLLLASVNFRPDRLLGSGNIYDVKVYEKIRGAEPGLAGRGIS